MEFKKFAFLKTVYFSFKDTVAFKSRFERTYIRGPFEKFVDSPYYSELELCGGAVTVSFSKYLPWQAMHFLQRSHPLLENVLQTVCCKLQEDSGTGGLDFLSPEIAWGEIWTV
jgi:hypothetical protein